MIGDTSGTPPTWEMDTETLPTAFVDWTGLSTVYGALNPTSATLSVDDALASKFSVYPNPATDFLTIDAGNVEISSVSVFNILGAKVLELNELVDNKINVSSLTSGIYLLEVVQANKSQIIRMVKK